MSIIPELCTRSPVKLLAVLISLAAGSAYAVTEVSEFNTDLLNLGSGEEVDLKRYARKNYIAPGVYGLQVKINGQDIGAQEITFYAPEGQPDESLPCITPQLVEQIAFIPAVRDKLRWQNAQQCLDTTYPAGMVFSGSLPQQTLTITVPSDLVEYRAPDWQPPSTWDHGLNGLLLDYNLNTRATHQQAGGRDTSGLSAMGTAGLNLGAWRLRADWQGNEVFDGEQGQNSEKRWQWNRIYAYRPLTSIAAKLSVGETWLTSDIFESFSYTGASLESDEQMLPPTLRGYSPEVTGIARTNALVTVSQQGRVITERQVAAGPFRIQDLSSGTSGKLDVKITEQDGSEQNFSVETASIPYLTRPGQIRYKAFSGRTAQQYGAGIKTQLSGGELSWGISNGWSLYGGAIAGKNYTALALGSGRDLLALGAISADITQSHAKVQDKSFSGKSYRVSYAKRFEEFNSQITFAGYRFSEKHYMNPSDFIQMSAGGGRSGYSNKQMYTVSVNQAIPAVGLSLGLNYSHQSYWAAPESDSFSLTASKTFDLWRLRNVSLSLSTFSTRSGGRKDDGGYLSLSLPWGRSNRLSYSANARGEDIVHQVGYSASGDQGQNYSVNVGRSRQGSEANAYLSQEHDIAALDASASYSENSYSAAAIGLRGGFTATAQGAALHRSGSQGGTRVLVDTSGVADIPLGDYGRPVRSNHFGKAVLTNVGEYRQNRTTIDSAAMPDNAEAPQTTVQSTLTEGAIGFHQFRIVSGQRGLAVLRLADGSVPPFGATVRNSRREETGILNDDGVVFLSGMRPNETMSVHWDDAAQCEITLPAVLPDTEQNQLLLPCLPPARKI